MSSTERLTQFYGEISSLDSIVRTLSAQGVDTSRLKAADLYTRGVDCQNLGGFPMLEAIAGAAAEYGALSKDDRVIDLGCGLGGPGRYLADRYGCAVTGVDLLPLRVDTARVLTQMTGLVERIEYRVADAADLPFEDRSFSQGWMLDASIHVREKAALFGEIARVLKKGGMLVLHDQTAPIPRVMAPVTRRAPYIAPSLPQLIRYVEDAGMRLLTWRDTTDQARQHLEERRSKYLEEPKERLTVQRRRRREQGLAALDGYIEALGKLGGRTGVLVARRRD